MVKVRATPARLALRDWLLVALSFSTGIYEAICFLSFEKVFTAVQTGNLVFLGIVLAGTRPPTGPNPAGVVISLVAFAVGAALAMPILRASGTEADTVEDRCLWPRRVSITLAAGLVMQIVFVAMWMATSRSTGASYIMVAAGATAMGMRMNAIRSLHLPGMSTTAFTATYIAMVSGAATRSLTVSAARRLIGGGAGMVLGALLGDWMLSHAQPYAPLVPVLVVALVIAIASVGLDSKRYNLQA